MWQCSVQHYDQSMGPIYRAKESDDELDIRTQHRNHELRWIGLFQKYRRTHLTKAKDRTIAFAGVARVFGRVHGLIYLAGHFAEHMPQALLWYASELSSILEPPIEAVPSWSCFSIPVHSHEAIDFKYSTVDAEASVLYDARLQTFQWDGHPAGFVPDTGYYHFAGLRLRLEAIILTATLQRWEGLRDQLVRDDLTLLGQDGACLEMYWPDISRTTEESQSDDERNRNNTLERKAQLEEPKKLEEDKQASTRVLVAVLRVRTSGNDTWFGGLVLAPTATGQEWRRLGFWDYVWHRSDKSQHDLDRLRKDNSRTLTLV